MQELANISLFSKMNAQELEKVGKVVKRESFGPTGPCSSRAIAPTRCT